jgi:hypothetical protein
MLSARKHPGLKRHPIPGKEENKDEEFTCGDPVPSVARRDFFFAMESLCPSLKMHLLRRNRWRIGSKRYCTVSGCASTPLRPSHLDRPL